MLRKAYAAIDLAANDLRGRASDRTGSGRFGRIAHAGRGRRNVFDPRIPALRPQAGWPRAEGGECSGPRGGSARQGRNAVQRNREALVLSLGESYLGLGIYDRAEPLLKKAYEDMKAGNIEIPASSRKTWAAAGADRRPLRRLWRESQSR